MSADRWPDGSRRVPLVRCPYCGHQLDAATLLEGPTPQPQPGDLSVCFGCGGVLQFNQQRRLQKMTATKIAALTLEEAAKLRQTQKVIRAFLAAER